MEINKALYQELILEHSKNPRNFGKIEGGETNLGNNPLCGDSLVLYTKKNNETLEDICFEGTGCAISQASTSMMTEMMKNKPLAEIKKIITLFEKMLLEKEPLTEEETRVLGKLTLFEGVKQYPARVKCALLAFRTLEANLEEKHNAPSSSE